MGIKVWLDGLCTAEDGWKHAVCPVEAIQWLSKGEVTHLSIGRDMRSDSHGTGYDVLLWIEQATMLSDFVPPVVTVHSANVSARQKMTAAINKIRRIERARSLLLRRSNTNERG